MPRNGLTLAALLALVLLAGCATNPATESTDLVLMSEEKEIELGKQLHAKVLTDFGVYPDPELQAYVNEIGQQLAAQSERSHLNWSFTVLDDENVNAFAIPGGYVYITRGIMAHLNSEAELAAVIGHEIGHVTARHHVQRDASNKLLGAAAALTGLATGTSALAQGTSLVGSAIISGFGRSQELEADALGARYIARGGYPTEAVFSSVELLKRREQFEIERARIEDRRPNIPHGVFATHPDNDQRFEEAVTSAAAYQSDPNASHHQERYLNRIDGMRWGPKSIPGVIRNNHFYHSQFGIKMAFPDNWRVEGETGRVQAISPENDAVMQVFVVVPGRTMTARDALERKLGVSNLKDGKEVTIGGLPAYIGTADRYVSPYGPRPVRAAAVLDRRARKAYIFAGTGRHDLSRVARDGDFIATIFSFDRMKRDEIDLGRPPTLKVVRAEEDTTMKQLAENSAVPIFAEQQLRLINGLYPSGEPQAGQLVKTVD